MTGTSGVFLLAACLSLFVSCLPDDRVGLIAWVIVWPVVGLTCWIQRLVERAHPALAWWLAVALRAGIGLVICLVVESMLGFEPGMCRPLWFWFLGHYLFSLVIDTFLLVRNVPVRQAN